MKIIDCYLILLMVLGYDYYSRRLIYLGGISIFDIIFIGYIVISIFNNYKKKQKIFNKFFTVLLILLSFDLVVGILRENSFNNIFSDTTSIIFYMFVYFVFYNNKDRYLKDNYIYKMFLVIAIINSLIYIFISINSNNLVYQFFNNRQGLYDDIAENGRLFGPDLVFWIPVIYGIFMNKYKHKFTLIITLLLIGVPSFILYKNRQLPIMIVFMIILILLNKGIYTKSPLKTTTMFYIILVIILSSTMLVLNSNDDRVRNIFNFSQDTSLLYRKYTNKTAMEKVVDNFPIGSGLGSTYNFKLNSNVASVNQTIVDNLYINLLLRVNIITFIMIIYYLLRVLIKSTKNKESLFLLLSLIISTPIATVHITRVQYAFIIMYIIFNIEYGRSKNKYEKNINTIEYSAE